jgi:hypothetical protein
VGLTTPLRKTLLWNPSGGQGPTWAVEPRSKYLHEPLQLGVWKSNLFHCREQNTDSPVGSLVTDWVKLRTKRRSKRRREQNSLLKTEGIYKKNGRLIGFCETGKCGKSSLLATRIITRSRRPDFMHSDTSVTRHFVITFPSLISLSRPSREDRSSIPKTSLRFLQPVSITKV